MNTHEPRDGASPPFFLVGSVRSGTTMLRLMLDHHPRISCFGEFEYAIDRLEAPDRWPSGEAFAEWLRSERRFIVSGMTVDPGQTYPEIVYGMFSTMSGRSGQSDGAGKPIAGAAIHRQYDRILRLWPDARFIYLYRDGRDVARSCVTMGWAGNVWAGATFWLTAERCWETLRRRLPEDRWIEVRNESLIENPQSELVRICEFLGDHFDPAMLDYDVDSTYSKPDPALTEQWRRKLSPRELRLVESRLRTDLQRRGYPLAYDNASTPGAASRAYLRLDDWWARQRFRIRRFGLRLWASDIAARKLNATDWSRSIRQEMNTISQQHIK